MADDVNKVVLTGRLGGDPEMKYTSKGTALATFSLAVSRQSYGEDKSDSTDWVRCTCWGRVAEKVTETLSKGTRAFVEGRISVRSYQTPEGQKRSTVEVVCSAVLALSGESAGVQARDERDRAPLLDPSDVPAPAYA